MHELALSQAIASSVERHAAGRPVRRVTVRIGYLRQVVPDSLQFSWTLLTEGTDLDGTELLIEHVPAVVQCHACAVPTPIELPILVCPVCHGTDVTLVSGEEFLIDSIDVMEVA